MLKNLKKKSIRKQTIKNLEKRDLSEVNAPLRTLGFLVDETFFQDFENLLEYSKFLQIQPKDVKVFSFIEYKKKDIYKFL